MGVGLRLLALGTVATIVDQKKTEDQTIEDQTIEDRTIEDQATGEQATGEQTSEDQLLPVRRYLESLRMELRR